jgi:hypothetical protein
VNILVFDTFGYLVEVADHLEGAAARLRWIRKARKVWGPEALITVRKEDPRF